ncbi:MAG: hypothetical protein IKW32_02155 [Bacteroidaceae bacterium]|nr:hypothetical protein [Bacteroidaceae bacterium]
MTFNAVLFFAVLFITGLFLYLSFTLKRDADKKVTYEGRYHIEVSGDFSGESLSIYVNDSLLLNGIMPDSLTILDIDRFAEQSAILIVDNTTDNVTPFNLDPKGSKVVVKKQKDGIVFDETPARF